MGQLFYGYSSDPITIPDRHLAYLKIVVTTKLRRNEGFTVSWRHPDDDAGERSTIWLNPSIPLRFVFDESEAAPLDRGLLREIAERAHSSAGVTLDVLSEYPEHIHALPELDPAHAA